MKATIHAPAVLALVLLTGCARSDPHGDAMKSLVAEQKQLDWIDNKIKAIDEEYEKQDAVVEKEQREGESQVDETPGGKAISRQLPSIAKERNDLADQNSKARSPWLTKRAEQLKRVDEARIKVDESAPH